MEKCKRIAFNHSRNDSAAKVSDLLNMMVKEFLRSARNMRRERPMKRRAAKDLFDYWTAVRRGRAAPTGASFDPSAVREAMREGFYLDVRAPGAASFSWIGSDLSRGLASARRGGDFLDVWGPDVAGEATRLLDVARRPCPVVAGAWGFDDDGVSRIVEVLALPLLNEPAHPAGARLIGVFAGVAQGSRIERLDGVSAFRILDDSAAPWRNVGLAARRRRDGWSARYAELTKRAREELGVGASAEPDSQVETRLAQHASARTEKHLTVIDGGMMFQKEFA